MAASSAMESSDWALMLNSMRNIARHWKCVTQTQMENILNTYSNPEAIPGFADLCKEHQRAVIDTFDKFEVPEYEIPSAPPRTPSKRKSNPDIADPEAVQKAFGDELEVPIGEDSQPTPPKKKQASSARGGRGKGRGRGRGGGRGRGRGRGKKKQYDSIDLANSESDVEIIGTIETPTPTPTPAPKQSKGKGKGKGKAKQDDSVDPVSSDLSDLSDPSDVEVIGSIKTPTPAPTSQPPLVDQYTLNERQHDADNDDGDKEAPSTSRVQTRSQTKKKNSKRTDQFPLSAGMSERDYAFAQQYKRGTL